MSDRDLPSSTESDDRRHDERVDPAPPHSVGMGVAPSTEQNPSVSSQTDAPTRWWHSAAKHWKLTAAIIAAVAALGSWAGWANYMKDSPPTNVTIAIPPPPVAGVAGPSSSPGPPCAYQESAIGSICIQVKAVGPDQSYEHETSTVPGDFISVMIIYKNTSTEQRDDVSMVLAVAGEGLTYLPGSSRLFSSLAPDGADLSSTLTDPGINIGSYAHGGGSSVTALFSLSRPADFTCGSNVVTLRLETWVGETTVQDSATVRADKEC